MDKIRAGIYGTCVADALGVPVEFKNRQWLAANPLTTMRGNGTYNQPVGTWSDDSSMLLCLADSLGLRGCVDPEDIMARFWGWYDRGEYTPWDDCFDCGMAVRQALLRYRQGMSAYKCGGTDTYSNGNGSLMRILPVVYGLYLRYGTDLTAHGEAMDQIHLVSALTHAHPISLSACGIYVLIAAKLLAGEKFTDAIRAGVKEGLAYYDTIPEYKECLKVWSRLRNPDALAALPEAEIRSGGYVVETLEAALWCLMNTGNYQDAALKAVNLGGDTDTTAAVAGGLAGLAYGLEEIPVDWLGKLAGKDTIERCCRSLKKYCDTVNAAF